MKQLILKIQANKSILATFNYDLAPDYDKKLVRQFVVQQEQQLLKQFPSDIFVRVEKYDVSTTKDPIKVQIIVTFSGISVESIRQVLEKDFPVIMVIGG